MSHTALFSALWACLKWTPPRVQRPPAGPRLCCDRSSPPTRCSADLGRGALSSLYRQLCYRRGLLHPVECFRDRGVRHPQMLGDLAQAVAVRHRLYIQVMLITPSATSVRISPMLEPMQRVRAWPPPRPPLPPVERSSSRSEPDFGLIRDQSDPLAGERRQLPIWEVCDSTRRATSGPFFTRRRGVR